MGLMNQVAQAMDDSITQEVTLTIVSAFVNAKDESRVCVYLVSSSNYFSLQVTNHLLKKPGHHFGMDLVAFNMQRGREFGIPGYMDYRLAFPFISFFTVEAVTVLVVVPVIYYRKQRITYKYHGLDLACKISDSGGNNRYRSNCFAIIFRRLV